MDADLRDIAQFTPGDRARVGSRLGLSCGRAGCTVGGLPRCVSPSHLGTGQVSAFLAALRADAKGETPPKPVPTPKASPPVTPVTSGAPVPEAAAALWAVVAPAAEAQIAAMVQIEAAKRAVTVTHVFQAPGKEDVRIEGAHVALPRLVQRIRSKTATLLVGPAGCGKSRLASDAAAAVGLPYYEFGFSEQTSVSDLLGRYMPGKGGEWRQFDAPFPQAYATGGLCLLDEADTAQPGVLLCLNGALASKRLVIPSCGTVVERHPDFFCIAAANTWGNGADRMYTARNTLDGSSTDRFRAARFRVDYDPALEERLIDSKVLGWMRDLRVHIATHKVREIVSTRFGLDATSMIRIGGIPFKEIREEFLASWSVDALAKLPASLR